MEGGGETRAATAANQASEASGTGPCSGSAGAMRAERAPGDQPGVRDERDRAAQRPGRRDRAGAPQGA